MATAKFIRWDRALKRCMEAKKDGKAKDKTSNRWNSDPMLLNQEAHELPPEKQREALDMMEDAPPELRAKIAPIWKYCFVQWHIYDAGREALDSGRSLRAAFEEESLKSDIEALKALSDSGDLDKAATTEKWCWKLLEPLPEAGTLQPWNDEVADQLLKVGKEERKEGVVAFGEERYDKAFWHFWQGLKLIARGPALTGGPLAKLRGDLYKNKSAAALKLKLTRSALRAANEALAIDPRDEKAWFRKACALEAMGLEEEARIATGKAGLVTAPPRSEQSAPPPPPPRRRSPSPPPRPKPANLIADNELSPGLHAVLESLVFIEVGVDSLAAVDMIMHIQAELPETPIPLTLVFDCPTVGEAVALLLGRINGDSDQFLRRKMNSTVWRAMCRTLRKDPLKNWTGRSQSTNELSEVEAKEILQQLRRAYDTQEWVQTTGDIARRSFFEQRSFLVNLRRHALALQRPCLQAHGYSLDADGLRKLECALVKVASKSPSVRELLRSTRIALQGGPNGIWAVNMEPDESVPWSDVDAIQSRAQYMKADPFGPERVNTNSVCVG